MSHTNIDIFNATVGVIFSELHEKFPISTCFDRNLLAKRVFVVLGGSAEEFADRYPNGGQSFEVLPAVNFNLFLVNTLRFLREEGFLQRSDAQYEHDVSYRLSAKALTVLNKVPDAIEPSLGVQITSAVKDGALSAGKNALGDLIGQIFVGFG